LLRGSMKLLSASAVFAWHFISRTFNNCWKYYDTLTEKNLSPLDKVRDWRGGAKLPSTPY
jgi:hypothetical protein